MKKILSVFVCVLIVVSACSMTTAFAATDKVITKVEVKGNFDVDVGENFRSNLFKVPSNANYSISNSYCTIYDHGPNPYTPEIEEGEKFRLVLEIKPNNGYAFKNLPLISLSNSNYDLCYIQDGLLVIAKDYSFYKKVKRIDLPAFPEAVPYGQNSQSGSNIVIDNGQYKVTKAWRRYDVEQSGGSFEGIFTDEGFYSFGYYINCKDGYDLADDIVITVGGKNISGNHNTISNRWASIRKCYDSEHVTEISEINIKIEEPEIGKPITKEITFETPGVKMMDFAWEESEYSTHIFPIYNSTTFGISYAPAEGNAQKGKYYFAKGVIFADKGYYFSENAVVKVNGKPTSLILEECSLDSEWIKELIFSYGTGRLGGEPEQSKSSTAKPVSSMAASSTPSSEPTPSSENESSLPESSQEVSHDTVSDESPADTDTNTDTVGTTEPDIAEKKSSPLPIILGVTGGAALLGGGAAAAYFLWFRKRIK